MAKINEKVIYEKILHECIKIAKKMPKGIEFTVPDLYPRYRWEHFSFDEKNKGILGKQFNAIVNDGELKDVVKEVQNKKRREINKGVKSEIFLRQLYKKI